MACPIRKTARWRRNVEAIIAAEGAVPATIAVMDGRIKIGLSDDEREALARDRAAP